tara:strand:- start:16000 stop:17859 length:1860 start_codon:yes stop_codon:yes gene_type:complete
MSIKTELSKLGSGSGLIYLADASGNITTFQYVNDKDGRDAAERKMLVSSPLSSNVSAVSSVNVSAAGGNITNLSYNGVSVFDTASPVTGATTTELATNLAIAINAKVSSPNYTAVSSGSAVVVYLDPAEGSSLNGTVAAFSTTGTAAITASNLDGGSYSTGLVDDQIGYRMYLNSSVSAVYDTLVGATDITSGVLRKSSSSPFSIKEVQISSGNISIDRDGAKTVVNVQTEGAIAADDLTTIDAGIFNDGDVVILRGKESAKVTTVKEGGNIELANNADFATATKDHSISLQYSVSDNKWYEISRSPGSDLSVSSLRSASISTPVQGVQATVLTVGGGSVTVQPGVDKGNIVLTGTGTLTGSWSYNLGGTPIDGDTFIVDYKGTFTPSGNNITIFGVSLTDSQIAGEKVTVEAKYISSSTSWSVVSYRDTTGLDLVDTTDLATKESSLGNPAFNGYLLSSTTSGTRSWIENNYAETLDTKLTIFSSTTGLETAYTYTIASGTFLPGESLDLEVSGYFNNNANAKGVSVLFGATTILANTVLTSPNNVLFKAKVTLFNISNTSLSTDGVLNLNGNNPEIAYNSISSLDFTSNNYDLKVNSNTSSASDISIRSVRLVKYSA